MKGKLSVPQILNPSRTIVIPSEYTSILLLLFGEEGLIGAKRKVFVAIKFSSEHWALSNQIIPEMRRIGLVIPTNFGFVKGKGHRIYGAIRIKIFCIDLVWTGSRRMKRIIGTEITHHPI